MTSGNNAEPQKVARAVVREAGTTLAQQAGIRMADTPAPLWQLLVLINLVSARISTNIALSAASELNAAGGATPQGMADLSWQQRVNALGRGRYVRYDESTATRLGECARITLDDHNGDLRRLADRAHASPQGSQRGRLAKELQHFPGIGPTAAGMFCREAQAVWPWLRPYTDRLARKGAERLGLPVSEDALGVLVDAGDMAAFAAGLVRVARDTDLAQRVERGA